MEEYLQSAIEISKAQASIRVMNEDEVISYIKKIFEELRQGCGEDRPVEIDTEQVLPDAKSSIKESKVTCLECGKTFRMLTKRHLAKHGMDKEDYLAKWGFKKGVSLTCKALHRMRKKKIKEMKLWERRTNNT